MKNFLGGLAKAALAEVKKNPALAVAIVSGVAPKVVAKAVKLAPVIVPIVTAAVTKPPAER